MLDKARAASIVDKLFSYTKYKGAANINATDKGVTRFANSEINQNVSIENITVTLTLYDGDKEAVCAANVLNDDGLRQLVQNAEKILAAAPGGGMGFIPCAAEPIEERANDGKLAAQYGIAERAAIIRQNVLAMEADYTASGALTLSQNAIAYGDSGGALRFAAYDDLQFNTVVTHDSGATGSGECILYTAEGCDGALSDAFADAARKACMARNPVSIDLGRYTVILSPVAFGDMMSFTAMPLCAKWLDDGDSFAIGRLHTRVFGANITLWDDVRHPLTRPLFFDYEGNTRQSLPLIEKGVIQNLLYDNRIAKAHGTQTTGHAVYNTGYGGYPYNLVMQAGDTPLQAMIENTERGIFINEFHYTNYVNPRALQITGLTRNGTFMVEDGRITKAVSTMRFTQNVIDALNAVTDLSQERVAVNAGNASSVMPAAKIEGFCFTSKP